MGNPAGVRRDFAALEERRMEAARLLRQGLSQSEVARELGVHRQSVSRWARELGESGVRGLRKAGRSGRPAKLIPAQLRDLERALKRGPEAFGFASGLWTASRVRDLIEYMSISGHGGRQAFARIEAECAENKLGTGNVLAAMSSVGLRRSREMVTIGKLENMHSVLFNLWRK